MKNCYIILCLTPANTVGVEAFIEANTDKFLNKWGNLSLEKIPTPDMPNMECYRLELSEVCFNLFEDNLNKLNARVYDSAESYLTAYPPKLDDNEI